MQHVLTVPEAMAALQLSRSKIYDLMRTGQLASLTAGRTRRIPAEAVQDFIRRNTKETA